MIFQRTLIEYDICNLPHIPSILSTSGWLYTVAGAQIQFQIALFYEVPCPSVPSPRVHVARTIFGGSRYPKTEVLGRKYCMGLDPYWSFGSLLYHDVWVLGPSGRYRSTEIKLVQIGTWTLRDGQHSMTP